MKDKKINWSIIIQFTIVLFAMAYLFYQIGYGVGQSDTYVILINTII